MPPDFGADPSSLLHMGCDDGGMVSGPRRLQVVVIGFLGLGGIVGPGNAWLSALAPSFSRAATTPVTLVFLCAAGWSLMFAGAASLWRHGRSTTGVTLLAAGYAWFMVEWVNPASAPALVFTLGLLAANAWPAL